MILKMESVKMFLNSDGFEKSIEEFSKKINDERKIKIHQFEKLVKLKDFSGFVEKVIAKYKSKEYCDRWYNRGIEPPEDLCWFLYDYSEKYGRECNEYEWEKYGNMFTTGLYYYCGYYFNHMSGQGGAVLIIKER